MRIGAANCILIAFGVDTVHSVRVSSRNGAHGIRKSERRVSSAAGRASVETYCTGRANSKKSLSSSLAHCLAAWTISRVLNTEQSRKIGRYVRYLYARRAYVFSALRGRPSAVVLCGFHVILKEYSDIREDWL